MNDQIHPTAVVSDKAELGAGVTIGPFSIVHDMVKLGDNCKVGSHCEIGLPTPLATSPVLTIGAGSVVRSHSVVYAGSRIGDGLLTGHAVTIRENSNVGDGFQLGSRGDVQGDCTIGDYTRTHGNVHIGKGAIVGSCVWLFPEVSLPNDPTPPSEDVYGVTIEDYAVVAAKVLLMPGSTVGAEAVIAAASVVNGSIPPGKIARGNPARPVCNASVLRLRSDPARPAYPWRYRFHRGYPKELVEAWLREIESGDGV